MIAILIILAAPSFADDDEDQLLIPAAGPNDPWRVSKVDFDGFDNVPVRDARKVLEMQAPGALSIGEWPLFDRKQLARDQARLAKLFQEYGFFQATVKAQIQRDERTKTVAITFKAHELDPVKITKVAFIFRDPSDRALWENRLRKSLPFKVGDRFILKEYQDAKARIAKVLADDAHPVYTLDGQVRVHPEKLAAEVYFQIEPGERFLFGPTTISGNQRISGNIIRREIQYSRGQPFSLSYLEKTQNRLLDTGFFSSVELEPQYQKSQGGQVPIKLLIKERSPHSIRFGLGYGTEDKFRVRILQANRNPFGLGDVLSFEGKISDIYKGLVGRWRVPHFPAPELTFNLTGGQEQNSNEAYTNRRLFARPFIEYRTPSRWTWYLGYNIETNRISELMTQVPDPDFDNQTFFISSVPLGLQYDSRDSALNPTKGTLFFLNVEVATEALGSDLEFIRPVANLSHVMPLPGKKGWYLAGRVKAGLVRNLRTGGRIPLIKRFFAGGANSVRGYPYQKLGPLDGSGRPLGGEGMVEASLELRYPIWKDLGGVAFVDAGNIFDDLDTDVIELRYTAGVGLRYNTPVGPLRLDIGYQINPPAGTSLDRYEIYLSVGQAF